MAEKGNRGTFHRFNVVKKFNWAVQDTYIQAIADKLINIPNDDTQNYHFCRLKLVVETPDHSA